MEGKNRLLEAYWDRLLWAARVNLQTGEYELIKADGSYGLFAMPSIVQYQQSLLEAGEIYADDAQTCATFVDLPMLRAYIASGERIYTGRFRSRQGGQYVWTLFEMTVPNTYDEQRAPWVSFTWRPMHKKLRMEQEAMHALADGFYLILKINLTTDAFTVITLPHGEGTKADGYSDRISDWWRGFAETGHVHPDDLQQYFAFFNRDELRKRVRENKTHLHFLFRRRMEADFRWVASELIRAEDYTDDNQLMLMYSRDVHDSYIGRIKYQQQLEFYCNNDALTELRNRFAYNALCDTYAKEMQPHAVGAIFADVNGLKYMNDTYGHRKGDEYLQAFAMLLTDLFGQERCYRISGDEFVLVFENIEREEFDAQVKRLRDRLDAQERPMAAIGSAWERAPKLLEAVVRRAEAAMYSDKKRYYDGFCNSARAERAERAPVLGAESVVAHAPKQLDKSLLDDRTFAVFSEAMPDKYLFLCNMKSNVSRWSKSAVDCFGLPDEYMYDAGAIWMGLIHPDDREMYATSIDDVFSGNATRHDLEYRVRNKSGQYVICTCQGVVVRGRDGESDLFCGTITNHGVIDGVDTVTNLRNNRAFLNQIRILRHSRKHALVMMIGLEMFGNVNLLYGHAAGDTVLRRFGEEVQRLLGARGDLFRLEGAVFGICTSDMLEETASSLYQDIQRMARHGIQVRDSHITLHTAGGAFLFAGMDNNENAINSGAAHALAQSRQQQGQLVFFHNRMLRSDEREQRQRAAIYRSVLNGCDGFFLCYQPIVRAEDGGITGMEALVRWKDADGIVLPDRFIPWLEEDFCIFELGSWVIRQSLADAVRVRELIPAFSLHINVAATQFERTEFRDSVMNALQETGFPPSQLCLELTDSCWNLAPDLLRRELTFFRSRGIMIAIDDFSSAGAALEMLADLPADIMKVTPSFVSQMLSHKRSHEVVGALTRCAHELGMRVCIEGVENQQVLDCLKQYTVMYHQGFYYSKPVEMEELIALLRQAEEQP